MKRYAVFLALGIVLAVLGVAQAVAQQPIRIVAFGDSTTFGQGVERYDSYPAKLEKALRARGYNVSVANAGVSGDTTADALARLDRAVPAGTQIVIVEFGSNDSFAKIDPAMTRTNLQTIMGRLRAKGVQTLLVGFRNVNLQPMADHFGAAYADFNFPDNQAPRYRIANDPMLRTRGIAHFNAAGYDQIVARILPQVELLIGRVKR